MSTVPAKIIMNHPDAFQEREPIKVGQLEDGKSYRPVKEIPFYAATICGDRSAPDAWVHMSPQASLTVRGDSIDIAVPGLKLSFPKASLNELNPDDSIFIEV